MNEHIRSRNNTVELCGLQRYACIGKLSKVLDKPTMKEYQDIIERSMEVRHDNMLEWQWTNLTWLCIKGRGGHSNYDNISSMYTNGHSNTHGTNTSNTSTTSKIVTTIITTVRWVKNISSTLLTKTQESLLACAPNILVMSIYSPNGG